MSLPLRQMKREFCGMHFRQLKRILIPVRYHKKNIIDFLHLLLMRRGRTFDFFPLHFTCVLGYLNFLLYTGLDIDDFVETSSQLIQPLEHFFNNVFVMVVC
jgi:hypothetical protein